jgi:hypothetical protein
LGRFEAPLTRAIAAVELGLMRGSHLLIATAALVLTACSGSLSVTNGQETITGAERFGWDQPASDAGELGSFRYAFYVDDARSEAADVSCTPGQTSGRFSCASTIPSMSSGAHTLQVAAFVLDAGVLRESTRSTALRVLKR